MSDYNFATADGTANAVNSLHRLHGFLNVFWEDETLYFSFVYCFSAIAFYRVNISLFVFEQGVAVTATLLLSLPVAFFNDFHFSQCFLLIVAPAQGEVVTILTFALKP